MSRGLSVNRDGRCLSVALLALCVIALLLPPQIRAAGAEHHLFDPTISLTGSCSTDNADAVPDPWCPGPPAPIAPFENPNITIDSFGDMYVSGHEGLGAAGRVDVFSPEGQFITELSVPGARSIAVDSKGNLYVHQFQAIAGGLARVSLFEPSVYEPDAGAIAYGKPPKVLIENEENPSNPHCGSKSAIGIVGLAVDPSDDHLFVSPGQGCVGEWSSAAEGSTLLNSTIGVGFLSDNSTYIAIDARHNRLYVSDVNPDSTGSLIQVFELAAPYAHLGNLDGHSTPAGRFQAQPLGRIPLDVDETSGHLIASDMTAATPRAYELGMGLGSNEELISVYSYSGFRSVASPLEVAVDNSPSSPNSRAVYVPSAGGSLDHTFAFRFSEVGTPEVGTVGAEGVTETEAVLKAAVNPNGAETTYKFLLEPTGSGAAMVAGEGSLPAGIVSTEVSVPVLGLTPGTSYQISVTAENEVGSDQGDGGFQTYRPAGIGGPCGNEALRIGYSAGLPDCRAYELVTPADTNGRSPRGAGATGLYFPTLQASPDGNKATFRIEGGTIPGFEGSGNLRGDNYLSKRGAGGWITTLAGPSGTDAVSPTPGAFSPDQEHSFWQGDTSPLKTPRNAHIRYPDGHSEPVGRGTLGVDIGVEPKLISQDGAHTIFSSVAGESVRLEPQAPPSGTAAIYDRTGSEMTHVVSLLPGDVPLAEGENARYRGTSLDGEGVAFEIEGSNVLYLRQHDETTYEVGTGLTYAGISEGGSRLFYLKSGNLFAFDTASKSAIQFTEGGDTTPVNVSEDGKVAYFISPDVLTGKKNPAGAFAEDGKENLYVSREGQIGFVGTVEPLDVNEFLPLGGGLFVGLGQWTTAVQAGKPALDTSRITPGGNVLLFESRASLTGYDTNGHTEIYRYDLPAATLTCLSCNPTGAAATGDASLQTILRQGGGAEAIIGLSDRMLNVRPSGDRAFFQSYEPLALSDVDGKQDVYEWEEQDVGSCTEPGGCVYLISSGQSDRDEHLFAVSENGNDVFFLSGSLLLGSDKDTTPSLYDARVGGGFAEAETSTTCQGEACRGQLTSPPSLATPATPPLGKSGNVSRRHCPAGKRRVKRHRKVRCVNKKHHRRHRQHHRSQHHRSSQGRG